MTIPPAYHESLPYIDRPPSPASLQAAKALIAQEVASPTSTPTTRSHPADPPATIPPLDTTRYEAQDLSSSSSSTLHAALTRAYTSDAYLTGRLANLHLLDRHGPPAWLLANHLLEHELRALEDELVATRREIDDVNRVRSRRQADVRAEMESLENTWRRGVGRVLETEIAVAELREAVRGELRMRSG